MVHNLINGYEATISLINHRELTQSLLATQSDDNIGFSKSLFETTVKYYRRNYKTKYVGNNLDQELAKINSGFSFDNLINYNIIVDTGVGNYIFSQEIVDLFKLLSNSADVFEDTMNDTQMKEYISSLQEINKKLDIIDTFNETKQKDLINDIKRNINALRKSIQETIRIIDDEISNFSRLLNNRNEGKEMLGSKHEAAQRLLNDRIRPLQTFLLYADDQNKGGGRISKLLEEFNDKLFNNYGSSQIPNITSCIAVIKKNNGTLIEQKERLNSLIKSSKEILDTIEMNDHFSSIFKDQFEDLLDGKIKNRAVHNCQIIDDIDFIPFMKRTTVINDINTEYLYEDLDQLYEELFEKEVVKEINENTEQNKDALRRKREKAQRQQLQNEIVRKVNQYCNEAIRSSELDKMFISNDEIDIYGIIIEKLEEIYSIYDMEVSYNHIKKVASRTLRHFKKKHRIIMIPNSYHYNKKHNIKYPIIKLNRQKKEIENDTREYKREFISGGITG